MAKYTVLFTRESYVEIEANDMEEARKIVYEKGIDEDIIKKGSDLWDVNKIYLSED